MPTITTVDTVTHYAQSGDGPDIVWICGGGGLPRAHLDPGPAAVVLRLPQHRLPQPRDREDRVLAGAAVDDGGLRARRGQPDRAGCDATVIVVGKSMGALTATQLALDRPDLVRLAIPMGTLGQEHRLGARLHARRDRLPKARRLADRPDGRVPLCRRCCTPPTSWATRRHRRCSKASVLEVRRRQREVADRPVGCLRHVRRHRPAARMHRAVARRRVRRGRAGATAVRQAGGRRIADRCVPSARGPRALFALVADAGGRGQRHHSRDHRRACPADVWVATCSAG